MKQLRLPRKTKASTRAEALESLGVTIGDVMRLPLIEPLLKKAGLLAKVWNYLETSEDEMARVLIAQRYKLSTKVMREAVSLEAYCAAAKLDTRKVLGLIFSEVYTQDQMAAELMAASAQPAVVRATIERAKDPSGTREREMLHKHSKFVPVPKTSVIFAQGAGQVIAGDDNSRSSTQLAVLPPIETTVRQLSDRFNERLLEAGPSPQEAIEAALSDEGDDDDADTEDD